MSQHERLFWRKVSVGDGCWEWLASRDPYGYGKFNAKFLGTDKAHRVAYTLLRGEIPNGLQIDHLCRNRGCVNPYHMEVVTSGQNTRRGVGTSARNAVKTHCKNGHAFTESNTYSMLQEGRPRRRCRTCDREAARRYQERRSQG